MEGQHQIIIYRSAVANFHTGQIQKAVGIHQLTGYMIALEFERVFVAIAVASEER
jgi:hypothetical protein